MNQEEVQNVIVYQTFVSSGVRLPDGHLIRIQHGAV